MYNIGICDDGENTCTSIEAMILQYAAEKKVEVTTKVWFSGEGLCSYLSQGNYLDLVFLDIELLNQSGIETGNYIRNHLENREMQIVYISAKSSYAGELFKTQPMDFLVKPIGQEQIREVLDLAVKIFKRNAGRFEFKIGKEYYYIPFRDIKYFASEGRKIKIIASNGEYEYYDKLKEVMGKLPQNFIMIHQSFVVNKDYIMRYTYEMVFLLDGTMLSISKMNRKQVREKLLREG